MENIQVRKTRVAVLSVISNTTLVVFKVIIGWTIGSVSVMSEAIHSGVDLLAALIAFFSVRSSGKPADVEHPFGHGKIENLSGTIEAILIFLAAGWIIYEAIHKLIRPQPLDAVYWGLGVMLISMVLNLVVSEVLFHVGRATDSMALQADAWHLRTDVWTSFGVMVGLGMIWLGKLVLPDTNLVWLDSVTAMLVALMIIRAAYQLTVQSGRDLLDASLTKTEEALIRQLVSTHSPLIYGFHRLRTRKSGSLRFIEFHLLVSGDMSVEASHQLTIELTQKIKDHFPDASVIIHIEPCNGYCSEVCQKGCLLSPAEQMKRQQQRKRLHKAKSNPPEG